METYAQLKERQQREFNTLPIGAAFTQEGFARMLEGWGLHDTPEDCKRIVSLGSGCYMQKKDLPALDAMSERHRKERATLFLSAEAFKEALKAEMRNHECQLSGEWSEALEALGLTEQELTAGQLETYKAARSEFWAYCCEHDLF